MLLISWTIPADLIELPEMSKADHSGIFGRHKFCRNCRSFAGIAGIIENFLILDMYVHASKNIFFLIYTHSYQAFMVKIDLVLNAKSRSHPFQNGKVSIYYFKCYFYLRGSKMAHFWRGVYYTSFSDHSTNGMCRQNLSPFWNSKWIAHNKKKYIQLCQFKMFYYSLQQRTSSKVWPWKRTIGLNMAAKRVMRH